MARARSIWIVMEASDECPVAAFTVKHELKHWLSVRTERLPDFRIYKTGDGFWQEHAATRVPMKDIVDS